jgi:hypothetical protein
MNKLALAVSRNLRTGTLNLKQARAWYRIQRAYLLG